MHQKCQLQILQYGTDEKMECLTKNKMYLIFVEENSSNRK
jgi:hypothetical protein